MIEDHIRSTLHEQSHDVPDQDAMRARVRAAVVDGAESRPNRGRQFGAVAACVLVVMGGLALVWQAASDRGTTGLADRSAILDTGATWALPLDTVVTEREGRLEVILPGDEGSAAQLYAVAVQGSSPDAVEAILLASASDTVITDSTDTRLDTRDAKTVIMESGRGTTIVGFQLDDTTFLSTQGVGRRHEVWLVDAPDGSLVLWIDTPVEGADAQLELARSVIESVEFVSAD